MTIFARFWLLCAALIVPGLAIAYVPDSDPVNVSAATSQRLGYIACTSSYSVTALTIRTWRYRSRDSIEPIRGNVICNADSSFKGMPARYKVACELRRSIWKCDAGDRELLVSTAAGVVGVMPNDVSVQRAVDTVQAMADVEYFESKDLGRIPIRSALSEGCWLTSMPDSETVEATCGTSAVWISFSSEQADGPRIVAASWVYPVGFQEIMSPFEAGHCFEPVASCVA